MGQKLQRFQRRMGYLREFTCGYVRYNIKSWLNINSPLEFLVFCVTDRCDSRCKACNVWQGNDDEKIKREMSLDQIDRIFADPLFSNLRELNLQGGEATMRQDLPELAETIIRRIPRLKAVGITSNGLDTGQIVAHAHALYDICQKHGVFLAMNFSIDGVGRYHDFARGENAFARVSESIKQLAALRRRDGFFLGTNCVLSAHNIENIDEILKFQDETFGITNLAVVEFREHFANSDGSPYMDQLLFERNPEAKSKLIAFLKRHRRPTCFGNMEAYRYEKLREMIEDGKPRNMSCKYKISSALLDHRGNLMLCAESDILGNCLEKTPSDIYYSDKTRQVRKAQYDKQCYRCYPYGFYREEQAKDFLAYCWYYLKTRFTSAAG